MHRADYWIERLNLVPHPEGGYFRESYRAGEELPAEALPPRYGGARALATAIYFLLPGTDFSALHRLRSDELWHFYAGSPLTVHVISPGGHTPWRLGPDFERGERFQALAPAGSWFGAELDDREGYALVGCTVAPGFDFADFELGKRDELLRAFPHLAGIVTRLTRG